MIGKLKQVLLSRFVLYAIGMIIAALLIWFIGPLLGQSGSEPLAGVLQRTLLIVLIPAISGLGITMMQLNRLRNSNQLAEGVAGAAAKADAAAAAVDEEVGELGGRLKEALDLLKKSKARRRWGSGWLYELPWYMFIGPPGSGKTTALTNSGLNFPLADQLGKNAVRGVGGTRSCDWWFTDQAVLIDTAGRYTTQDSEQAADAGAWSGFLKILKKFRKRQPINGAIVAVGLSDLLGASEAQRVTHAKAIKARLKELYAELGVQFPVYVLFTKADLIAGFVEFFEDLDREGREQVWGMTFELKKTDPEGGLISMYPSEFELLIERLNDRLEERLQQETDIQRRALIWGFPQQVASLKDITEKFLGEIFAPNRYEERFRLRGIYMTSGTQDGTPIDRLMGAMAASFGISRQQVTAFSGTGRSYFLTRLLKTVIFGEAGLVSSDAKLERRSRLIQYGVLGGSAFFVLLMGVAWGFAYINNASLIEQVQAAAAEYNGQIKDLQLERVADPDLRPILRPLEIVRDIPGGYAHRDDSVPIMLSLGLYQGDKLGAQSIEVYYRALSRMLLPRMLVRLEQQIAQNQNRPEFLYEALKVYLMLGQQGKLDKSLVRRWMALDWGNIQFPGPENEPTVKALQAHLDVMLSRKFEKIPLNGPLIDQTRAVLLKVPLAERAYSIIKTDPKVAELPEWRISEHGGPAVARALMRTSGKSLAEGIPGLYTYVGYFKVFRPILPDISQAVAKEAWVLGPSAKISDDPLSVSRLQADVTTLYLTDFVVLWNQLLADISFVPFSSVGQSVQILNILSAPDSPIKQVLTSAANETWLSKQPAKTIDPTAEGLTKAAEDAAKGLGKDAAGKVPGGTAGKGLADQGLQSLLGPTAIKDPAGEMTDQKFKALHDLVGGNPPAIDAILGHLNDLYLAMNRVGASGDAAKLLSNPEAGQTMNALKADADRSPEPLKSGIVKTANAVSTLTAGGARAQLNALWTASVVPFCVSALENRYPAVKTASNEITPDDFAKLFSKGGLIDSYFTQNLQQFVDISKNPWVWQKAGDKDLGIPPTTLAQFQRAASIRDNMFIGSKVGISFEIVPVSLDPVSTQVVLDVDGQTVSYDHGPPRPVKMQWPGSVGHVRISFQPQAAGEQTTIEKDGVWAWFRILNDSQLKQTTGADKYLATFTVGKRSAAFEIRANSVINPFVNNQVEQFRCPPSL